MSGSSNGFKKLIWTLAGGLALSGVLGGIYLGNRVSSLETLVGISPAADLIGRISALEARLEALAGPGPRYTPRDAAALEAELRAEITSMEAELRAELRDLRSRIDYLHQPGR